MNQSLPSYPDYKSTGLPWLGEVPAHWGVKRNKYLFRERDARSSTGAEELLTVSQYTGITKRADRRKHDEELITTASSLVGYKIVKSDDLVINIMLAWNGSLGTSDFDGIVSPAYCVYEPISENDPHYFHYLLRSPLYKAMYKAVSTGVVDSRLRLYTDKFFALPALVPPVIEQKRIVEFLGAKGRQIAKLLRAKRQLIKLLQEQKQALILRAVTQGLNIDGPRKDSGIAWLGEVPTHWETVALSRIAKVGNGSTPSRANPEYWFGGDYPWLNSSHANRDFIDSCDQFVTPKALAECHLPRVPAGSVLVAITGQGKTRGKAALLGIEATINQHVAYITPKQKITPEYLHLVLTAAYSTLRSISEDAGSTKGALTCADLKRFKIAFPSIPEQRQLLEAVEKETHLLDETIDRAQREIELIQEYRTRLVADVVTGRVDVRHLTIATVAPLPEEDDLLDEEEVDEDELIEETLETDG
jgi:type I restriction enzyme S subunit